MDQPDNPQIGQRTALSSRSRPLGDRGWGPVVRSSFNAYEVSQCEGISIA